MAGQCIAFSNNDVIVIAWSYGKRLPGCVGFDIRRVDATAVNTSSTSPQGASLPAMASFKSNPEGGKARQTTASSPIQKFFWKDLFARKVGAAVQPAYVYQIIPLQAELHEGRAPTLSPMHGVTPLYSNEVSLTTKHGPEDNPAGVECFFNRGILATQALVRQIPQKGSGGAPNKAALLDHIATPNDPIRAHLAGDILDALPRLLQDIRDGGGTCYGALYELSDTFLESQLIGNHQVHLILSNTFTSKDEPDGTNADARHKLHASGVDVTDRIFPDGSHIGHNKFLVYCNAAGDPEAVLTGSTNWTPTGLCAQTNNAMIIRSPALAAQYLTYWQQLKADTDAADGDGHALQGQDFRTENATPKTAIVPGAKSATLWLSPNTPQKSKKAGTNPPDMDDVYARITAAKAAVLFLAFDPGQPSIVDAAADALKANKDLFIRGALTNADRAANFVIDLHNEHMEPTDPAQVVPAEGIDDAFGAWEKELNSAGHAVIHDKIVVIDPFDPEHCTVILGSHNLGNKASYTNDENFLIIEGNQSLAQAYAVHVLDVYDHYRWRYLLKEYGTKDTWGRLKEDDSWQKAYFDENGKAINSELTFWLAE